ncbi:hypothetical protein NUSPORA_00356 [Nucleospora cyclopteri]
MKFLHFYCLYRLYFTSINETTDKSLYNTEKYGYSSKDRPIFSKYAINTECTIAGKIGSNIIKNGGNAVDAAIATALTIGIVNSFSSGIGGGGFMIIKDNNHEIALDFREKAPINTDIQYFIKNPKHAVNTMMSACVPGEIKGFHEAHNRFGKLPWKEIFREPIELCQKGFKATSILITKLRKNEEQIIADEGLRNIYTKNNNLIREGDLVYRKALGNTLKIISEDPESFYKGILAEKIVDFVKKKRGNITKEDLLEYDIKERPLLHGNFLDFKITTSSFPTSGAFLILGLNILQNFDLEMLKNQINNKNDFIMYHLLIETFKHMFSKRGEAEDPDFMTRYQNKVDELISSKTAFKMFNQISLGVAQDRDMLGITHDFVDDNGTTHLNVVDENGMAVLLTSSVNLEFGSKILDPETGILFNNHIDDFYIPGRTNYYNLVVDGLNLLEPKKRSFSSASPIILENDKEILFLGAAGGTKIPTSVISTILYYYVFDDLKKAINNYRIHDQLKPNFTLIESTFPSILKRRLTDLGHTLKISHSNTTFTSVNGIVVKKGKNKIIQAVSDSRKAGFSCGE